MNLRAEMAATAEMSSLVHTDSTLHFGISNPCSQSKGDLQLCGETKDVNDQDWVKALGSINMNNKLTLKNQAGAELKLRIVGLEGTAYSGQDDEVEAWGIFYLTDIVNMQVIGVVEGTACPCNELVLMTCEDKKLYAYDGEKMHLVASSFKQLSERGLEYPASKSYYYGEAFKDMTEKDWEAVMMGDVGRKLEEEHQELVKKTKSDFLRSLKS